MRKDFVVRRDGGGMMNGIALFERAGIPLQAFGAGMTSTLSGPSMFARIRATG
jgi:hypothetical protein